MRATTCPCSSDGHARPRVTGRGGKATREDADEAYRSRRRGRAQGQRKEEDTEMEDDAVTGALCFSTGTGRWGSKRRGKRVKAHDDDEAEMVDKLGRARASRSCAIVANSKQTIDLGRHCLCSPPTTRSLVDYFTPNLVISGVLPRIIKEEVTAWAEV